MAKKQTKASTVFKGDRTKVCWYCGGKMNPVNKWFTCATCGATFVPMTNSDDITKED